MKNTYDTSSRRTRWHRSTELAVTIAAALAASSAAVAQTSPFQSPSRNSFGSGLGQSDLPNGGRFEPRIEAALQYASNLTLQEDGEPQIDTAGLELAPGFYGSYSSGNFIGAIDYSLIGRTWEDSDYNDVSHRLNANGSWYALPEWFRVRGQASYTDGVIDPRNGLNYGGLGIFGPSNLTEVATASVSPTLQHRFNVLDFTAQYSYGRTWYLDEGKGQPTVGFVVNQDSTDQSAHVGLGTADTGSRASATVYYDWQRSEFDTALPYEYERAGIDAGYQVSRTITLLGSYGRESDLDASTTQGGLDSDFWDAGLRWEPNDRTSVEGRYGNRFFGDSWSFSASHQARMLEFNASYSEQPQVETRRLSLGEFDPGILPPWLPPGIDISVISSSPFVARDARAGVRAVGSRTTLGLTVFHYERDYIRADREDETGAGAAFNATRKLASNLSADFTLSYSDYDRSFGLITQPANSSSDQDVQAVARLNRQSGEKLTLSAEAGYLNRSGDQDYDGWWTGLRARWTP